MREHERSFYVFLPRILKGTLLNLLKRLRYCHAFIAQPLPKVAELTSLNFGVVTPPPLSVAIFIKKMGAERGRKIGMSGSLRP